MPRCWMFALMAGCSANPSETPPVASPDWTVTCGTSTDNALRLVCTLEGVTNGPVTVAITERELLDSPAQAQTIAVGESAVFWGFLPEEAVVWTATSGTQVQTGTAELGALPDALSVQWNIEGSAEVGPFLVNQPCGNTAALYVVDRDGRIRWYQDFPEDSLPTFGGNIHAYAVTPDGTLLVGLQRDELRRIALDGRVLARTFATDIGPAARFHHDAYATSNRIYALFAEPVTCPDATYVLDGIAVYDTDLNPLTTWRLADHVDPCLTGGPAGGFWQSTFDLAIDWSHANSVWATDDDGTLLVSLRHQDAVIALPGPDRPEWPSVDWVLTGTDAHALAGDFTWQSPADGPLHGFDGQHHATLTESGTLTVFDNSSAERSDGSRGVEIQLDGEAATVVAEWPLDTFCAIQGATEAQADGTALVTCSTEARVTLVAPFDPEPLWSLSAQCDPGTAANSISRFTTGGTLPL